jgi:hypothetical protein
MHVSEEEAAFIYARACRAWYGKRAMRVVKRRIEEFRRAGDDEGVNAWTQLAAKLSELSMPRAIIRPGSPPAGSGFLSKSCPPHVDTPHPH